MYMVTMAERRKHRRFTLQVPVAVYAGNQPAPVQGRLIDLAASGTFVAAGANPSLGSGAFVYCLYSDSRGTYDCEAAGRVVRVLPFDDDTGIAVEFSFANSELIAFLRHLERAAEPLKSDLLTRISRIEIKLA